jgi:starvation-inducible DNA-binding protein
MSEITTVPTTSADPDVAAGVAQFLAPVVTDLTALSVDGKQAHWHVRGENFYAVHKLLDKVVDAAREYADLAAERVVALGLPIDARIQTTAEKRSTPDMPAGFQQSDSTIANVVAQLDASLKTVSIAVDELATIDPVSQDVAIEIARGLEKYRWFLYAHIAAK